MTGNVLRITLTVRSDFDEAALRKAAEDVVNKTVDAFQEDYERSVQHFEHKPTWQRQNAHWSGNVVRGSFGTSDPAYVRLSKGWPAHAVASQVGKVIRFKPDYRRKTRKGVIPSFPGGYGPRVLYRTVTPENVPWIASGVEGQDYDIMIAQHNRPLFQKLANGIFRATRKP